MTEDDGTRAWSKELRAEPRRRSGRQTSRWLTEEGGSRSVQGDGSFHGLGEEHVNHTRRSNVADANHTSRPTLNQQSLPCPPYVSSLIHNQHILAHMSTTQPNDYPIITANTENVTNQPMILGDYSTQQPTTSKQPLLTLIAPDSSIMDQSLPINSQPTSPFTVSPNIKDALKNIPPPSIFLYCYQ
jgi:hypothetical protein